MCRRAPASHHHVIHTLFSTHSLAVTKARSPRLPCGDDDRARRSGGRIALLFVDLDRFKKINDSLGHSVGDALLCEVARRLAQSVRAEDLVARLGCDEFVVLAEHVVRPDDAARVAAKLIAAIEQPYAVAGREFVLSASIGIGLYPDDAGDLDTLLRVADTAMYAVKQGGRSSYGYYEPSMHARALAALEQERDLRGALRARLRDTDPDRYRTLVLRVAEHLRVRALTEDPRVLLELADMVEDPALRLAMEGSSS